jgi:predicted nucleotidyltransferase component of viral defense system
MTVNLLSRQQLSLINKRTLKYRLTEAEKDYFLAIVLDCIYSSDLKDGLVFKGGTALHHCYLSQLRFSEDLDFTSRDNLIEVKKIIDILDSEDFLEVKKHYISDKTLKIEQLKYQGPLDMPNSLKVEIDFTQNVVIKPIEMEYKNYWDIKPNIKVMDIKEISAEKIRAMSGRARYRDFYDQYMILKNYNIDKKEIIDLVKQKEIRETISPESIMSNWQIAKKEKTKDLQRVYYKETIPDTNIENMLKNFSSFSPIYVKNIPES